MSTEMVVQIGVFCFPFASPGGRARVWLKLKESKKKFVWQIVKE